MSSRPARVMQSWHLLSGAFFVAMWLVLWGSISVANVLSGVLVAALLVIVFPMRAAGTEPARLNPLRIVQFGAFFVLRLVQANLAMALTVLSPRPRLNPGIVGIPLRTENDTLTTVVSAFITLTPGTLTLEVRLHPRTLFVHVLQLDDEVAVRTEVARIEAMAIRAFGTPSARAALAEEVAT